MLSSRRSHLARIAVLFAAVSSASGASADEPVGKKDEPKEPEVAPDRPDASDSTATVEAGWSQLELGVAVSRVGRGSTALGTPFVLRTGLSESVELRLGGDGFVWQSDSGVAAAGAGDLAMGFKVRFFEEGDYYPSVGIEPIVVVPVASQRKGLGSGRPTFLGTVMVSKDLPSKFHADVNLAANAVGIEGESGFLLQGLASLSLSRSLRDGKVTPFWEIYALTTETPGGKIVVSSDFGAVIQLHPRIAVDAAIDIGITSAAPVITGTAGVSFLLGQLF
jgi:hypothetical protein